MISLSFLLFFFHACASTTPISSFSAGEQKNSLPFVEKKLIEEVHSVAIPPFYGDQQRWREITDQIFISSPGIAVVPLERVEEVFDKGKEETSVLEPEERHDSLAALGRSVNSDSVLNGVILSRDNRHEIILQLISSKDSRVLWWQAAEYTFQPGLLPQADQKALLTKMLEPLLSHMAKREKPFVVPVAKPQPGTDEHSEGEAGQKTDPQQKGDVQEKAVTKKSDKKPKKSTKPKPSTESINPM